MKNLFLSDSLNKTSSSKQTGKNKNKSNDKANNDHHHGDKEHTMDHDNEFLDLQHNDGAFKAPDELFRSDYLNKTKNETSKYRSEDKANLDKSM